MYSDKAESVSHGWDCLDGRELPGSRAVVDQGDYNVMAVRDCLFR